MNTISVFDLKKGVTSTLIQIEGDPHLIDRLVDIGLHTGAQIEFVEQLPFSGPIIIRWDNTLIALRKEEALCLKLQNNKN